MKRKLISVFALISLYLISFKLEAQESQKNLMGIFTGGEAVHHIGWFMSPEVRSFYNKSQFKDNKSLLVGGKLGLMINHSFYFGITGYAKIGDMRYEKQETTVGVGMGYGGLFIGKSFLFNEIIHPRIGLSGGYGGSSEYLMKDNVRGANHVAGFMYIEPELALEINISNHVRLVTGATYRIVNMSNFELLSTGDLDGLSINLAIVFGKF
ncbi:hypothetical protein K5X82_06105 [Halosquirtibacter xylanolyticus]|uniref:hypothetical protein n=1 Tax=Halosquirtibacter xylanolyticus TaxID=3374599 RepID=UPI003748B7EA|nr:hypothetical protein K5X82_06105 [Prolixibacteraceae bacterium]